MMLSFEVNSRLERGIALRIRSSSRSRLSSGAMSAEPSLVRWSESGRSELWYSRTIFSAAFFACRNDAMSDIRSSRTR